MAGVTRFVEITGTSKMDLLTDCRVGDLIPKPLICTDK